MFVIIYERPNGTLASSGVVFETLSAAEEAAPFWAAQVKGRAWVMEFPDPRGGMAANDSGQAPH